MISKKKALYIVLVVFISTLLVATLLTYYFTRNNIESGEIYLKGEEYETLMKYFEQEDVSEIIAKNYIHEVDDQILINGSMRGIMDILDDGHSAFYTEEEYQFFDDGNDGSFIAQGMMLKLDEETDYAKVIKVFADTPAYEASLQVGDLIKTVDGVDTGKEDLPSTLARLRGIDGTEAVLEVLSSGEEKTVTLVRRSESVQVVYNNMVNDEIGYINVCEFSGKSTEEFAKALEAIKKEGAKGVIIDLRGTPGGNITQVAKIANMFLEEGNICSSKGRESEAAKWDADADVKWTAPVAILVDGETSGVAEVFAAALQDRDRAIVLGEKTSGNVAVTSYYKIPASGNVVKLVTAEYYTASGKKITDVGVTPDEVVDASEIDASSQEDAVLLQAAKRLNEQL
ncbi:MAG: PDZ domain-containing protein [Christensenellaceae bacterium]|nr:PDZ domain-containing protein [Christensenellaceae bacterium]